MTEKRFRYSRVRPRQQPRRGIVREAASTYWAPLLGSRLIFPASFDRSVARLLRGDGAAAVPLPVARWYFGKGLHIDVDPALLGWRISDFVRGAHRARWVGAYFLDTADWSDALSLIRATPVHKEMSQIVEAGLDYRATEYYAVLTRIAEEGRPAQRNGFVLKGRAEIDAYYQYCVDLIVSVERHGLARQQFGSLNSPAGPSDRRVRSPTLDWAERDIGIAINEDGELIRHLGGKHRTAIAQALRLPSMPVEVRMVHVRWLARQMEEAGLPAHKAVIWGIERLPERAPQPRPAPETTTVSDPDEEVAVPLEIAGITQ